MNSRAIILAVAGLLLALPAPARDQTDVVVLTNGDRLTGEVKYLHAGVLYVSVDYVDGNIGVQWSKVARLESAQLFIVEAADGSRHSGTLSTLSSPSNGAVMLAIAEKTGRKTSLEELSIISLRQTSNSFWERFEGEINAGFSQMRGNDTVQYSLGSEVQYRRERWAATANFNSNFSIEKGSAAATRNQFNVFGYHLLPGDHNFYFGVSNLLEGSVQRISRQVSVGGGVGRWLVKTNESRVAVMGGLAWQHTEYSSSEVRPQTLGAGLLGARLSFFRFKKLDFNNTTYFFQAFTQPSRGRLFLITNTSFYYKFTSTLSWSISFYGSWDSQPPDRFPGTDYGSTSGLRWTFGAR